MAGASYDLKITKLNVIISNSVKTLQLNLKWDDIKIKMHTLIANNCFN